MLLVIIHSMHVQQCRAMQIGVCMHTVDFLYIAAHTRKVAQGHRQALSRTVHCFLLCTCNCSALPTLSRHVLALFESVSKPCVMLTGVREGWASARMHDQQIHKRTANCDAYHPQWLVAMQYVRHVEVKCH
jgi:hypothetical protein